MPERFAGKASFHQEAEKEFLEASGEYATESRLTVRRGRAVFLSGGTPASRLAKRVWSWPGAVGSGEGMPGSERARWSLRLHGYRHGVQELLTPSVKRNGPKACCRAGTVIVMDILLLCATPEYCAMY